jgi:hypothetical protein
MVFRGRKKEIIEYGFLSVHFTLAYSIVILGDVWYLRARKKEVIKNDYIFEFMAIFILSGFGTIVQ